MTETKNYINSYNEKLQLNKLDWKQINDIVNEWKLYKSDKEINLDNLWHKLKEIIYIIKMKPILLIEKTKLWVMFETYIQKQSGFEWDITSKNFSEEALHKYFIGFLKWIKGTPFGQILNINVKYNWQKYNLADICFYRLYPGIVNYQVVINWTKKEINNLGKEIKK